MDNSNLHVVTCIFNPKGYKSRTKLYYQWLDNMKKAGVTIHVIECACTGSSYTIAPDPSIHQYRVSSNSVLWAKENLLNIVIRQLPKNAEYVMTTDADIFFLNENFPSVIMHELDSWPVIQSWSKCNDLGPEGWHMPVNERGHKTHFSFGHYYANNLFHLIEDTPTHAHPGYSWSYKRDFLVEIGGLFEKGILGGADTNMALAFTGKRNLIRNAESVKFTQSLLKWSEKAYRASGGHVGCANLHVLHGFHGYKAKRFYVSRKDILVRHDYDPENDLKHNDFGVLEFTGNKPELEKEIAAYFASREEDEDLVV